MKKTLLGILFLAGTLLLQAQVRPNIVVFLVDDMGWMDTSVPFGDSVMFLNRRYYTPNMQRMAAEGVKFTNAYSTPVCTPSRVSMMTGVAAAHHHITNWTHIKKDTPTDQPDSLFSPADWNYNGLSPVAGVAHTFHATPLPQLLKEAGYFTVHVGKAHFGSYGTPGSSPYNLGFMVNVAGSAIGHPQSFLGKENYGNIPGKAGFNAVHDLMAYYGTDTFLTEALTLEALKAIEHPAREGRPFFLHLSHYAVHDPLQADRRFYQKYIDAGLPAEEARYASMIEGMDKSLGDVLNYLKQKGLEKNTVILFVSDNGGLSYVPPRGGTAHTHNLPLKAGKGSVYEGGIRVPMLVKWPGVAKAGSTVQQYVIIEDFFPSILEMSGINGDRTMQQGDGKSFVSLLKNPAAKDSTRALVWHIPNKWQPVDGPGINYKSAIRQGNWKLVYNMRSQTLELYNLANDVGERDNLAKSNSQKTAELALLLTQKLKAWKAPIPLNRQTGKPVSWPDELIKVQKDF